ncbi:hypothetical protein BDR05DRAFT_971015, partial [Suillus weaverae]
GGRDRIISEWAVPSLEDIPKDQASDVRSCSFPSLHLIFFKDALREETPKEQVADNAQQSDCEILVIDTTARDACITGDLATANRLLTQEINTHSNDYNSYANRSFVMARKADWDRALDDALKSISIQPSLMGCISKGIALCGKRQFQDAMKAFDLAFIFVDADLNKTRLLLLIKAIALFNANQHEEAILRVQELATARPDANTLACNIVEAYLHVQVGINASDDARHNEAAGHFIAAVNTINFSSISAIHSKYDIFVVLFGWDLKSLWLTAHQHWCHSLRQPMPSLRTAARRGREKCYGTMRFWMHKCMQRFMAHNIHRWEEKEPLLHDIQDKVVDELNPVGGIVKLQSFCKTARAAGYRWGWIDTCCIDQANNVELQKSLNSMFVWYHTSALTMVYLSDVPPSSKPGALARSAWNTRGWTVPEFLAPKVIRFYQNDWTPYLDDHSPNHKESIAIMQELEERTGIDGQTLVAFSPGMINAREKLQWASTRVTTVEEDIAYSLFGIFGVQLPIMYGEKKQNALGRLLQEIIAQSGDITALDWVGTSSEFNSSLPADITSYEAPPYTLPYISEDEMQRSISSLQDTMIVELAVKLYSSLDHLSAPRFANHRLHLPCITFPVTEVRRRPTSRMKSRQTGLMTCRSPRRTDCSSSHEEDPLDNHSYSSVPGIVVSSSCLTTQMIQRAWIILLSLGRLEERARLIQNRASVQCDWLFALDSHSAHSC